MQQTMTAVELATFFGELAKNAQGGTLLDLNISAKPLANESFHVEYNVGVVGRDGRPLIISFQTLSQITQPYEVKALKRYEFKDSREENA